VPPFIVEIAVNRDAAGGMRHANRLAGQRGPPGDDGGAAAI
jgi:hypothetical protein